MLWTRVFDSKPLDPRLIEVIARQLLKLQWKVELLLAQLMILMPYAQKLNEYVYRSSMIMRPIVNAAKLRPMRIVICEGEDERALLAVSEIKELKLARPIIIGRPFVIENGLKN